jgi:D-alanine-D-alanine ligase
MLIGLTYDLRSEYLAAGYGEEETAEFDQAGTIDALDDALRSLGHRTDRIGNVVRLVGRLAAGDRWDLVFNIAEGLHGMGREAQVPALLDAFEIPYTFSDPLVMCVALDKALTKRIVRDAGVPTPPFAVVSSPRQAAEVDLAPPLLAKPLAEGTGKGITERSVVRDLAALPALCEELLARYSQPVLVEGFLPGREFTVGLVGTGERAEVLGTLEIVLLAAAERGVYSYVNKEQCEQRVQYPLVRPENDPAVRQAEQFALRAWRAVGCRDGGRIDLRCDAAGEPQFIEVNPLAGLHPTHSDLPMLATALGIAYEELIDRIVRSAAERRL